MFSHKILFVTISLVIFHQLTLAQKYCAKVDFNRTNFNEFRECSLSYLPELKIKEYSKTSEVHPYRKTSRYYLSTDFINQYSCIMTSEKYALSPTTRIEAAVFLKSFANAFVKFFVYDTDNNMEIYSWRNSTSSPNWFIFNAEVKINIPHAVVYFPYEKNTFRSDLILIFFSDCCACIYDTTEFGCN